MPILIQMSGMPGSGKSTIAKLVGQELPAVILDYDVTKTALLDQGISFGDAGRLAYETGYAMAESILGQGANVILDSLSVRSDPDGWAAGGRRDRRLLSVRGMLPE